MAKPLRIGIDTGGTFTDLVVVADGTVRVHKVASTPHDPAHAVLEAIATVRGDREVNVVHGTTVGLNAILTGNLARTALVTNDGFRDLIEIGRQARTDLYDLEPTKPIVPVPRELRFTIGSRREADGRLSKRPSGLELEALRRRLAKAKVETIAISLLHGYAHPEDELLVARALRGLGVPITCGGALARVVGEFERASCAILNAAITPVVSEYLALLAVGVRPGRVQLLRSSGGILDLATARREPARALFSGPAGGIVATRALCIASGETQVAAFDMGGTSTDVSLVGPDTEAAQGGEIAGLPVPLPAFALHTVGCGGGSLAWRDAGGALRVGPQSAGADPGPACYGKGDEPTITDAHMALGHLGPETLLGGAFAVDPERSVHAIERLGNRLGLTARRTAEGILEVANATMMRALLVITAERAVDPASVPLVAFGGAGGLHAVALARRLAMPYAIVPEHPGAFSALGLAVAHASFELVEPVLRCLEPKLTRTLAPRLAALGRAARSELAASGAKPSHTRMLARVRYVGQGQGLVLPWSTALAAHFAIAHERYFGFVAAAPIELVELRVIAEAAPDPFPRRPRLRAAAPPPARLRRALVGAQWWRVVDRGAMRNGTEIAGPVVVEDYSGTTVLPAGARARATPLGLRLTWVSK